VEEDLYKPTQYILWTAWLKLSHGGTYALQIGIRAEGMHRISER